MLSPSSGLRSARTVFSMQRSFCSPWEPIAGTRFEPKLVDRRPSPFSICLGLAGETANHNLSFCLAALGLLAPAKDVSRSEQVRSWTEGHSCEEFSLADIGESTTITACGRVSCRHHGGAAGEHCRLPTLCSYQYCGGFLCVVCGEGLLAIASRATLPALAGFSTDAESGCRVALLARHDGPSNHRPSAPLSAGRLVVVSGNAGANCRAGAGGKAGDG